MECEFVSAVEQVTGKPPPQRDSSRPEPKPVDHDAERMRHEAAKDKRIADAVKDREQKAEKACRASQVYDSAEPIKGSLAARYLKERGLALMPDQARWLRFVPSYPYYHGQNEDGSPRVLGRFPAMVARMFAADMTVIGLHSTYLSDDGLRKARIEIDEDGRTRTLPPRKMYGRWGMILLSDPAPAMAFGEGIETTLAWYQLGVGPDDIGIAAAGSIGNLCGSAMGSIPHPILAGKTIPNGEPNPEKPGMEIPEMVRERYFLGDRDDPPHSSFAHLLTQVRRQRALGARPFVHIPPELAGEKKVDWNDTLLRQSGAAA
jgi:hypothetical protein